MSVFSYVSKYILCGGAGSWTMSQRPAVMLLPSASRLPFRPRIGEDAKTRKCGAGTLFSLDEPALTRHFCPFEKLLSGSLLVKSEASSVQGRVVCNLKALWRLSLCRQLVICR